MSFVCECDVLFCCFFGGWGVKMCLNMIVCSAVVFVSVLVLLLFACMFVC